eukprot:366521-Chlamydomonas_euryale.AAC.10
MSLARRTAYLAPSGVEGVGGVRGAPVIRNSTGIALPVDRSYETAPTCSAPGGVGGVGGVGEMCSTPRAPSRTADWLVHPRGQNSAPRRNFPLFHLIGSQQKLPASSP